MNLHCIKICVCGWPVSNQSRAGVMMIAAWLYESWFQSCFSILLVYNDQSEKSCTSCVVFPWRITCDETHHDPSGFNNHRFLQLSQATNIDGISCKLNRHHYCNLIIKRKLHCRIIYINTSLVLENRRAAMIFIKYILSGVSVSNLRHKLSILEYWPPFQNQG